MPPEDPPNDPGPSKRGDDGPTFDDPPTTEVGFALAEKVVGGRFKLGERLSWGGMGTIYRALDLVTQREVAVKIPHLGDPLNDVRFQAESEAVRSVVSPMVCTSVIGYVAHGADKDEPFLAMELVAGLPLWRHLQRGALDPEASFGVARRIASALATIHLGGWIHRDIKPGNVVVAPDGSVKLLDFGLSRPIDGDGTGTATGQLVGTLGYMAPEQFTGGSSVDPRTDVYALGVVLYECLSGRRAFKRTLAEVVTKAPEDKLDIAALNLAPAYTEVLERCLSRAPGPRPGDGIELLVHLLAARDARFARFIADGGVEVARRVTLALLRGGAARVDGDVAATALLAEILAEVVAPSVVLRVGCDPRLTSIPMAHASALADAIAEGGQASLAARVQTRPRPASAERAQEVVRSTIVVVEDATWCDSATVDRLVKLAAERDLFVLFASSFDQLAPTPAEEIARERSPSSMHRSGWPTDALDPMERWVLRAASMFGRRFPIAGVEELVGGDEGKDLGSTLARVRGAGWIEPAPPVPRARGGPWFRFVSGAALNAARGLASPHEHRLGAKLAKKWEGSTMRGPEVERLTAIDVACAALSV